MELEIREFTETVNDGPIMVGAIAVSTTPMVFSHTTAPAGLCNVPADGGFELTGVFYEGKIHRLELTLPLTYKGFCQLSVAYGELVMDRDERMRSSALMYQAKLELMPNRLASLLPPGPNATGATQQLVEVLEQAPDLLDKLDDWQLILLVPKV